jgi:hypothetical protein
MKSESDLKSLAFVKKKKNSYANSKTYNALPYIASSKSVYSNPLKYYESQVFAKEVVPKVQTQNQFSFLLSLSKGVDHEGGHAEAISSKKDELLSLGKNEIAVDDMLLDTSNLEDESMYESLFPESMDEKLNYSETKDKTEHEKQQDDKLTHPDITSTTLEDSVIGKKM